MERSELHRAVAGLLTEPEDGAREFCLHGATVGEVYGMAAWLLENLPPRSAGKTVCLAVDDKAVFAASLLAALAGGPVILLPYAFSAQALAGLQEETDYKTAIGDVARPFPENTQIICPKKGDSGKPLQFHQADPERELLRLYTGGSTDTPRLWLKSGLNIFGESLFLADHFGVSTNDRILATISPYHVYGLLYSITLPLVSGAGVSQDVPSFPEEIVQTLVTSRTTILISVPAHYRAMREKRVAGGALRLAFSSAGPLDPADNQAFSTTNAVGIVEVYGSTETGGVALRNRSQGEDVFTPYPVLDWRLEEQTLKIDSPFLSPNLVRDESGYFTTGDRVEKSGSKGFLLRGRADSVTKVAGNRVDLEEIATLIKQQPAVTDCLVWALEKGGGRQSQIVAVVEGTGVNIGELKKVLARRFEPYALPRALKVVARIPVKDNGKYDRHRILRLFE
jgi:acyl-coenzyme A synthetase/AMP-(fatty) acid ligase